MKFNIKNICNDIFLFIALFLVSEIFFRSFVSLNVNHFYYLIFDLGFALLMSFILLLINPSKRKIVGFSILLFFDVYLLAQIAHEVFFGDYFTVTKITIIKELFEVKGSTTSSFEPLWLLMLFPSIIYFLLYKYVTHIKERKSLIILSFLSLGVLCTLGTSISLNQKYNYAFENDFLNVESPEGRFVKMTDHVQYIRHFGIPQYLYRDIREAFSWKLMANSFDKNKIAQLTSFVEEYSQNKKNDYTGLFQGKNVIMVLCESLYPSAINAELTPTLHSLQNKGYNFTEHYAPLFEYNTADSEFISLTGMLPSINYGLTNYSFSNNNYSNSLPNLFKKQGYNVNSFHSGTKDFYNRTVFHNDLGFSYFYDYVDLKIKLPNDYVMFSNWIDDKDLFQAMLENTNLDKPFFNFVITGSGHMPYSQREELEENYNYINSLENYKSLNDETKMYYAAQMKLDQGIKYLIDELHKQNKLDDTVIILYGDHYPYGITDLNIQSEIVDYSTEVSKYKGTFIIYNSQTEGKNIENISSSFDIHPTIVNLFGLSKKNWYIVGSDALDNNVEHYVLFKNYSVFTNGVYYKNIEDLKNQKIKNKINAIMKYGEQILLSNYYNIK